MSETTQVPQQKHPTLNTIASREASETLQQTSLSPYARNTPKQKKGVATTLWQQPLYELNLSLVERYSLQRMVIKETFLAYQVLQYSAQQVCILASMLFQNRHEPSYSLPSASKQSRGYYLLREYHQPYEDD